MSEYGTYNTACAPAGRVRVSALRARCGRRPAMRFWERGTAIGVHTAMCPMPTTFRPVVRGQGDQPMAAIKPHHLRPSECLM